MSEKHNSNRGRRKNKELSGTDPRRRSRELHLRRYFGIGIDEYEQILQRQAGCCAICKRSAETFKTRLAVDHNHKTLEIRGLLCPNCNRYVIGRHTDPLIFDAAAAYLRGGTGWFVPQNRPRRRRKKRGRRASRKRN